jgi:hypothetical protein
MVLASVVTGCQKETEPPEAAAGAQPPASKTNAAPAPTPAAVDAEAPPTPATAEQISGMDAGVGEWVESTAYKFKVTAIQRCAEPASPGTGDASPPPDRPLRVGVAVHVFAKYDELFVAARDVTIEKDGVIIQPEVNPKPSAGCAPLLEPRSMRHDQINSGVVVFQLPDESFARTGIVAYKPTRWGGAPRVEVKLAGSQLTLPKGGAAAKRSPK